MFKLHLPSLKVNSEVGNEVYAHTAFLVALLILVTFVRGWFKLYVWQFWLGGAVGALLPLLDHIVYVFLLRPQELTSQRVISMIYKKQFKEAILLLVDTRHERTKYVVHTILFQSIFVLLTFLVMTSSGSLFGKGLVLAFSLHLLVDQCMEFVKTNKIPESWFYEVRNYLPQCMDKEKTKLYIGLYTFVLLAFGLII